MARPDGLETRGAAVFRALSGTKPDAARKALALEAGRMADRLEKLDKTINGDEHLLKMMHFRMRHELDDDGVVTVELVLDKALAEARQLQLAYTTVVKALAVPVSKSDAVPEQTKDTVDDIAARRAARRAAAGS